MVGRGDPGQLVKWSTADEVAAGLTIFLPVAFALFGSRVLSKVPVGPIYLYDASLVVAAVGLFFLFARHGLKTVSATPIVLLALVILPAWGTVLFLMSDFSRNALREYHPFLTLLYALFVALASRYASPRVWRWGTRGLVFALIGHWTFLTLRMANDRYGWWWPESELGRALLTLTGDADGWLLGLFAALLAWRYLGKSWAGLFGVGVAVVTLHLQIALLDNRAAQLSAVLMVGLAVLLASKKATRSTQRKWDNKVIASGAIALVVAISLSLSLTDIGERYQGAVNYLFGAVSNVSAIGETDDRSEQVESGETLLSLSPESLEEEASLVSPDIADTSEPFERGEGTVRARLTSWMALLSWMAVEPSRLFFGVGMGTDYFWDSGAREKLLGDYERQEGENRWPHNFLLTLFALTGITGVCVLLALLVWVMFLLIHRSFLHLGARAGLALIVLSGVVTVSFFGVVFENPFGSIPFAWAVGIAFARHPLLAREDKTF